MKQNMNMNWRDRFRTKYIYQALIAVFLGFVLFSCGKKEQDHSAHSTQGTGELKKELTSIVRSANTTVISDQATIKPLTLDKSVIEAKGFISIDPGRNYIISSRIAGRIERLYVRYEYQWIKKGQKVLDIYSPELRTFQEEYLFLFKNTRDHKLITHAEQKLLLLGLNKGQMDKLRSAGEVSSMVSVYSPYSGYVIFNNSVTGQNIAEQPPRSEGNSMNMGKGGGSGSIATAGAFELKEGNYVNEGQTLFQVNDMKEVWGILTFDAAASAGIKLNTPVKVFVENQTESLDLSIDYIEQKYMEGFLSAHIHISNSSGKLKPNMLISGEIISNPDVELAVPNASVLDLGKRKLVWVKIGNTASGKKIFEAREIVPSFRDEEYTGITKGLQGSEEIAKDAGYMLDSESIIE